MPLKCSSPPVLNRWVSRRMAHSRAADKPGTQRAFRRSEKLGDTKLSIYISKRVPEILSYPLVSIMLWREFQRCVRWREDWVTKRASKKLELAARPAYWSNEDLLSCIQTRNASNRQGTGRLWGGSSWGWS